MLYGIVGRELSENYQVGGVDRELGRHISVDYCLGTVYQTMVLGELGRHPKRPYGGPHILHLSP